MKTLLTVFALLSFSCGHSRAAEKPNVLLILADDLGWRTSTSMAGKFAKPWELYNLATDPTELQDLAAREPDRVKQLAVAYEAWAARCKVPEKPDTWSQPQPRGN